MARTRKTDDDGTLAEPEQRELFQYHQHNIRRFEILKSTPVGLLFPQNLQLELRDVDAGIPITGHPSYLSSGTAPVFVTSDMKWWKVKYMLPPSFKMFPHHPEFKAKSVYPSSEIVGIPLSPPHDSYHRDMNPSKPWPMAEIKYSGWQGITQMNVGLTVYEVQKWMTYDNELQTPADICSRWTISRNGYSREYTLTGIPSTPGTEGYKWRGNKKILNIAEMNDGFRKCNGNLKLEDKDARLVAVYKQRRDSDVLGSLTIFTDNMKEKVPLEVIVSSCLAIVIYERIGFQNMFGQ